MDKMTLIVFAETGHVLGAASRMADPEGERTAEQLVGDGLELRDPETGDLLLTVPAQHLEAKIVDRIQQTLLAPYDYVLEGEMAEQKEELATPVTLDISENEAKVDVPVPVLQPTKAWLLVGKPGDDPVLTSAEISGTSGSASLNISAGKYRVLALIPGYRRYLEAELDAVP